ncbi:MAG: SDR family NAD(P)-dependent oxidoreductase [Lachnospiraceae bacterium]
MNDIFFKDRFKDKVMIITGFATGIGKETAIRAAKEGAKLVLVDRKEEAKNTFEEIIKNGGSAKMIIGDLSTESVAKEMVKLAIDTYGRLDIAINNAGVMGNPSPVHALNETDLDYTMNNNFKSVYYCAKAELNVLVAQGEGGVIINNASIAGLTGLPGNAAYVASKHAVNGLTRNMALDYAKYNIRVNSVNPAGTDTPIVEEAMAFVKSQMQKAIDNGVDLSEVQSMAGQKTETMQKRNATAKEQAASILFLASDDATHITGTLFATDGGWTAY